MQGSYLAWASACLGLPLHLMWVHWSNCPVCPENTAFLMSSTISGSYYFPASSSMRMPGLCGEQCHMIYTSHLGLSTPQSVSHGLLFSSLYIGQLRVTRLITSITWRCFPNEDWEILWSMSVAMQGFLPDFFHKDSLEKSKVTELFL